jgi:hypothetical protein
MQGMLMLDGFQTTVEANTRKITFVHQVLAIIKNIANYFGFA